MTVSSFWGFSTSSVGSFKYKSTMSSCSFAISASRRASNPLIFKEILSRSSSTFSNDVFLACKKKNNDVFSQFSTVHVSVNKYSNFEFA